MDYLPKSLDPDTNNFLKLETTKKFFLDNYHAIKEFTISFSDNISYSNLLESIAPLKLFEDILPSEGSKKNSLIFSYPSPPISNCHSKEPPLHYHITYEKHLRVTRQSCDVFKGQSRDTYEEYACKFIVIAIPVYENGTNSPNA